MELFSRPRLKVFSAVCTNLCAAWFLTALVAKDVLILTTNIGFAILSLILALVAEESLEKYEH